MSSQLIGEIELSLRESLESQITPNENLDDEITIDFSPFVDDREADDYDRSSEEGRVLFISMTSEIIKPVNEIKFYRFFQIGEVTPVRINYYTYELLINFIIRFSMDPEMRSQYKSVIPHIYKILFVLPPLHTVLSIPGTSHSSEISGAASGSNSSSISSSRSIPRNNRTASRSSKSETMADIKAVHPIITDIPKSFVQKKTEEMERYISKVIKTIPDKIVMRCISKSLKKIEGGYRITTNINEDVIEKLFQGQIIAPITIFFEMIWDHDTTSKKKALECRTHISFARPANRESLSESETSLRSNVEHIAPDFAFIRSSSIEEQSSNTGLEGGGYPQAVGLVIEAKKPFTFLNESWEPIKFDNDMILSDIFRQSLKYSEVLGIDHGGLTDAASFVYFIIPEPEDANAAHVQIDCEHDNTAGSSKKCSQLKIYKIMTIDGLDENNNLHDKNNIINTPHLIGLLLYLSNETLLCASQSKEGKEKMNQIMSQGLKYTSAEMRVFAKRKVEKPLKRMKSIKENKQGEQNELIDQGSITGTSYSNSASVPASSSSAETEISTVPGGFKEYKVIQDSFENLTQVILLRRSTFERIFMNGNNDRPLSEAEDEVEDEIVMKIYSIEHLRSMYILQEGEEKYCEQFHTDEEFIDYILENFYQNEVMINQIINHHNSVPDSTLTSKRKINSPKMISHGAMISGEYLSSFVGFYIAFEYIKSGGDLEAKHLSQLQDQINELHSCNIAHGDLSPRNIIVDINGIVRVIDFNNSIDGSEIDDNELNYLFALDNKKLLDIQKSLSPDNDQIN